MCEYMQACNMLTLHMHVCLCVCGCLVKANWRQAKIDYRFTNESHANEHVVNQRFDCVCICVPAMELLQNRAASQAFYLFQIKDICKWKACCTNSDFLH